MRLELKRMEIRNFKGTSSLEIAFSSGETHFYGANGTGKSSIQDALCWLLFNKDSHGNAPGTDKFREKPYGRDGKEIHNLDTTVTAYFTDDGERLTLSRKQTENWTQVRGQPAKTFKGNTSQYWINDVETKAGDFKARVDAFAPEAIFRMITSLGAFNSDDMPWKDRRSILINLNDNNVDDQLLASDEFAPLRAEIEQRNVSVDNLRKVLTDQRRMANQELQLLPARIDEAHRLRPEITDIQISDAKYLVADCQKDIQRIDGMIADLQINDSGEQRKANIARQEAELFSIRKRIDDAHAERCRVAAAAARDAYSALGRANFAVTNAQSALEMAQRQKQQSETLLEKYRSQYLSIKAETYTTSEGVDAVCPRCGQEIPQEQYESAVAADKAAFEKSRKKRMDEAAKQGTAAKQDAQKWAATVEEATVALEEAKKAAQEASDANAASDTALGAIPADSGYENADEYLAVKDALDKLRAENDESDEGKIERLNIRKRELSDTIIRAQSVLSQAESMKTFDNRIAELENSQRELGDKVSHIDALIMLAERFVTARCGALEESINAHFPTLRWKLFETQINGGITDVCSCMVACGDALVDYGTANTGSKVNADIEIVRVLSEHYNVYAPLFVDNAERINYIAKPAGQLITLTVSTDNALRIEHIDKDKEAV